VPVLVILAYFLVAGKLVGFVDEFSRLVEETEWACG